MLNLIQAKKDIAFLSRRLILVQRIPHETERETGASSDSIVSIAYGNIDPTNQIMPMDNSDLMACERMWMKLPEHRKTDIVKRAMNRVRNYNNK